MDSSPLKIFKHLPNKSIKQLINMLKIFAYMLVLFLAFDFEFEIQNKIELVIWNKKRIRNKKTKGKKKRKPHLYLGLKPAARPNFPPVPAHFLSSAQPEVLALTGGSHLSDSFPAPRFSESLTGGPLLVRLISYRLPLSASTSKRRRNHEANPTPNQPSPAAALGL